MKKMLHVFGCVIYAHDMGQNQSKVWQVLKSPRTISLTKVFIAAIGLVHALDELLSASKGKTKIGFHPHDHSIDSEED